MTEQEGQVLERLDRIERRIEKLGVLAFELTGMAFFFGLCAALYGFREGGWADRAFVGIFGMIAFVSLWFSAKRFSGK